MDKIIAMEKVENALSRLEKAVQNKMELRIIENNLIICSMNIIM